MVSNPTIQNGEKTNKGCENIANLQIKAAAKITVSNKLINTAFPEITIEELRLLFVYLSKVNPFDESSKTVTFNFKIYKKIIGDKKANHVSYNQAIISLKSKTITLNDDGCVQIISLFKECNVDNIRGIYPVTFTCSDAICKYIFGLKGNFTTFELDYILSFNSTKKIKLYMYLRQFKSLNKCTIEARRLCELLTIKDKTGFKLSFLRKSVLNPYAKEFEEHTDIVVDYKTSNNDFGIDEINFTITDNKHISHRYQEGVKNTTKTLHVYPNEPCCNAVNIEEQIYDKEISKQEREDICKGFEEEIFSSFSCDKLKEFFSIAQRHIPDTFIVKPPSYYCNEYDMEQYRIATYIKSKILYVNALVSIKYPYNYIKKAIERNFT